MATNKTNYLELKAIDHHLSKGVRAFTSPAALAVALHTADPTETGAVSEVANLYAYARQVVTFGAASVNNDGTVANTGALSFTASGGAFGTITHFSIWDSATYGAGNCLYYGSTTPNNQAINDGNTLTIAIGGIVVGEL